ncbi:MAG: SusC/RagA family TonB-linked outer membrane protein [Bacteroidales bacterium]|nr:SusC/RagA family TonB-linked outer membrane protein [Bacteroidales bacterium]
MFDENGNTVPGATIMVKGTTTGTISAVNGQYSISAKKGEILIFSYVGYEKQEIPIKDSKVINVYLKPQIVNMNEVVVMGYSDKTKTEISSSISVVKSAELKTQVSNDLGQLLQGKVSGVQVVSGSGQPGSSASIRIRGVSTIKPGSQGPLYVVDGIMGGSYDPNDVESVTVLKDAGATGLYGASANQGVIIVTTKSGQSNKPEINFSSSVGFSVADQGHLKMMNGSQFYTQMAEQYRDPTLHKIDFIKLYQDYPASLASRNYNWVGDAFKPALVQNYHIAASGGNKGLTYYTSATYYDQKGTFLKTGYDKLNVNSNLKYQFNKNISLENRINIYTDYGETYDYMDLYYTYLNLPWDNPYDSTGAARFVDQSTKNWYSRDHINPFNTIQNSSHNYTDTQIDFDLVFNWNLTKWLSFSSANRGSFTTTKSHDFVSPVAAGTYYGQGYISETQTNWKSDISTDLLKFHFTIKKHNIDGLAGYEVGNSFSDYLTGTGQGLPVGFSVPSVASNQITIAGSNTQSFARSFISQVNYNYNQLYFVTASFRRDAISNFPPKSRFANFPSFAASWLVSNMDFMKSSKVFNLLKVRASYGLTGNSDIGASRYMGLFSLDTQYDGNPAATPSQLQNYNLTWERTKEFDAGVDLEIFKRLSLTVDYYKNKTTDLLVNVSVPTSTGFEGQWQNVGNVTNTGIDASINGQIIDTKNIGWSVGVNFGKDKDIVSGLNAPLVVSVNAVSQIYRNGGNMYTFYLPKWLGVDPQTGGPLWEKVTKDANGKVISRTPTSDYSQASAQEVGSALPKFQGGFYTQFHYKNVGLSANFTYSYGNKVYNFIEQYMSSDGHEPFYNYMVLPTGSSRWEKPGDHATEPSMQNNALSTQPSSRYVQDGSFIKLNSINIYYRFSEKIARAMHLKDLTISLDANDIYTWTNYWGQNPEATLDNSQWSMPGVNDFRYPNNRQFLFNIEMKL